MSTPGDFGTNDAFCDHAVVYVGLWNIRQLVKISPSGSQSPDPNAFLVSPLIKSLVVSKCPVYMLLQDE